MIREIIVFALTCFSFQVMAEAAPPNETGNKGDETQSLEYIRGDDLRIEATDCLNVERDPQTGVLRMNRVLNIPRMGYQWDNPGARIRFRTDSPLAKVHLLYTPQHGGRARNSRGIARIIGSDHQPQSFTRPANAPLSKVTGETVSLSAPPSTGFHDYEIILPYGDSVEIAGVSVVPGATWDAAGKRPPIRYVAYGDSVTHGFSASDISNTYPFRVGEIAGWQAINAGFAGRSCREDDGAFLGGIDANLFSILIGVNDWQGGVELERFRASFIGLIKRFRAEEPRMPVYVITPLWVAPSWEPEKARYSLEAYREAIREVVADQADVNLHLVEGPLLTDHNPALFDRVAVHPNDAGFAQIAERLAARMMQ